MTKDQLYLETFLLLEELVRIPSYSKEENKTADLLEQQFASLAISCERMGNNVWARNKFYDPLKHTLLLNSHHDTVRPAGNWTWNPHHPTHGGNKLIGLGVNDAGASLVSLLAAFRHFYAQDLPFNVVFAATAEEEISGENGIEKVFPHFGKISFAIVGEPTGMNVAVAEKGLLVLDCVAMGKAGHAARKEGINAISLALADIAWFNSYQFENTSKWLGETTMSVTMISGGTQHNVVPAECKFTVDVRFTDMYTADEILDIIRKNVKCEVNPRSKRLKSSGIDESHCLFATARALGKTVFGSPTLSDQALIPVPSIKMGPGESSRSHTSDEYILLPELQQGIEGYIEFIQALTQQQLSNETLAEKYNVE
jgi:acetylornithine deacetylase